MEDATAEAWKEVQETFDGLRYAMDNHSDGTTNPLLYAKALWADVTFLIERLKKDGSTSRS